MLLAKFSIYIQLVEMQGYTEYKRENRHIESREVSHIQLQDCYP